MSTTLSTSNLIQKITLFSMKVIALAESQDLFDHLNGDVDIPTMYSPKTSKTDKPTLSENYLKWRKSDHLLRGWIIGTLTEEALGLVVGLQTTQQVWEGLQEAYAQDSQQREFTLHQQLTYLKKKCYNSLN